MHRNNPPNPQTESRTGAPCADVKAHARPAAKLHPAAGGQVIGLDGCYHGDTLGAMDCQVQEITPTYT